MPWAEAVVWVELGVAGFLFLWRRWLLRAWTEQQGTLTYLSEELPLVFHRFWLCLPKLSCDLANFRIGQTRMLSEDFSLMTLTIKDESYIMNVSHLVSKSKSMFVVSRHSAALSLQVAATYRSSA